MMPGKNEASDVSANGTVEDANEHVDSINGTVDSAESDTPAEQNPDPIYEVEPGAHQEVDEVSESTVVEGEDPLGFGEQRMGEDQPFDEVEDLRQQLAQAEAKAAEHWDRLLRLQADMENQRKRAQNDVAKARKFALEGIVGDLLPVRDSVEMGLTAAQAPDAELTSILEGADLTLKMLAQVFEKNNIAEINPVDEKFNPEFHQAMSMQEVEGKAPNTVTGVMQKGYTLNDRLVRPALVMVAK